MLTSSTSRTQSGLFVRNDAEFGLLVYSPYSGLIHVVHPTESAAVKRWLDGKADCPNLERYERCLGAGWMIPLTEGRYSSPHLLPNKDAWTNLPTPHKPIVINWLLTGRCPLKCMYCYAEDLMRCEDVEPDDHRVEEIAHRILDLDPLVVVLTGGDPLVSPHLAHAIRLLSPRVGVVVDTSAYTFSARSLELFKENNVVLRISLDSERPRVNDLQRPTAIRRGSSSAMAAVRALCDCLDAGLCVTVQSVATKKTANDLLALGDKLFRLGLRSWRVLKIAPSKSSLAGYRKLCGEFTDTGKRITGKLAQGPYEYVFRKLREAADGTWQRGMSVEIVESSTRNSVVLVGPDGRFYTESNVSICKVVLDERDPYNPSLQSIKSNVNLLAHAERYLNLGQD
ncbi:MAG: radical SAM protein [Armatimonadota bacterium]